MSHTALTSANTMPEFPFQQANINAVKPAFASFDSRSIPPIFSTRPAARGHCHHQPTINQHRGHALRVSDLAGVEELRQWCCVTPRPRGPRREWAARRAPQYRVATRRIRPSLDGWEAVSERPLAAAVSGILRNRTCLESIEGPDPRL